VYAAYPEAVAQEHAVLREPLLNLLLLAAASLWLSTTVAPSSRRLDWRALGAGLLCGLALGVTLWALLAILACLAALPGRPRLSLPGLAFVLATRARRRLERFAAAWFLVTIAAFVLSRPYYDSYNSFLVPSTALLAGIAATGLLGVLSRLRPAPALAAVATAV